MVLPPPAALAPSVMDACPEPLADDNLSMPEIQLHIAINVLSCLNTADVARSLMVEEVSLCEFLLDSLLAGVPRAKPGSSCHRGASW
jgi:hypothetical protein